MQYQVESPLTYMAFLGENSWPETDDLFVMMDAALKSVSSSQVLLESFKAEVASEGAFERQRGKQTAPEIPGKFEGSYLLENFGFCMAPVLPHGSRVEVQPDAPIWPGTLCAFAFTYGWLPKIAMYWGRYSPPEPIDGLRRQPEFVWLFFQAEPACILAVCDEDLIVAAPVTAIIEDDERREPPHWPFDIRNHHDLAGTAKGVEEIDLERPGERNVWQESGIQGERWLNWLDELSAKATETGGGFDAVLDNIKQKEWG